MAYFVAAGLNFSPLSEAVTPTVLSVGNYYDDTGKFGAAPMAGKPFNDRRKVTFPGVAGTVEVDHLFRQLPIWAVLVFTGTAAQVNAASKSALNTLNTNTRYTVSLDGASYDGCKLSEGNPVGWVNMSGGCLLIVPCIFNQLSTSN